MQVPTQSVGSISPTRRPTKIFLTETTFIYAIGYGIALDDGNRLSLQLIIDKVFKLFSLNFPCL